jgi:hypothetical protein
MKTELIAILEVACVAGALTLMGCSSTAKDVAADAGCPTKSAAGCPAKADAGCPAGCPAKSDAGCPGKDAGCPASDAGCPATGTPGTAQTPPTGKQADIEAWLKKGDYKTWKCEPAAHDNRSPSPHGKNRICSNDKLSAHGAGEYPIGSASVKEIYADDGTTILGYATGLKTAAGGGGAWYWYENVNKAGLGLVANGLGTAGNPLSVCVGCHAAAGSDATHSGHDQVYTQVK